MSRGPRRLMLRWSWRDLRRRWGLVLVTAVIIAIGTGTYAGLGGTTAWRLESQDASYAQLGYHDLRVRLPERTDAAEGDLPAAARSIPRPERLARVEERLVAETQVDASTGDQTVLVPGEVVGMPEGSEIDTVHLVEGRRPEPGRDEVLLDAKFADARDLPTAGELRLTGDRRAAYPGVGYSPEYFRVIGGGQQLTGDLGYAVMYAPLDTAQRLTGRDGRVNGLAIALAAGADPDEVAADLTEALAGFGATVETREDDTVRRTLYADARNDEQMWTFLGLLILAGASFAAFNLVSRMVEAERHEIGVGMALGAPPRTLAIRPLLVGLQIALLGTVIGVGVGLLAGGAMRNVLTVALPLPVWETPFPAGRYAQAAVAGVLLPMIATVIPVRRALRVEPVDALRTVPRAARRGGPRLLRRWRRDSTDRRRGRTSHVVAAMPIRNVLRAPRRTLLTALGIAAAITTLVTVLAMIDSIFGTLDRSDAEIAGDSPDRLEVALAGFLPTDAAELDEISAAGTVARAEARLRLSGTLTGADGEEVDTVLDLVDFDDAMWTPTIAEGRAPGQGGGLVISEKAAADLGVGPGNTVTLTHPVREGVSYRLADTDLEVTGIHPNPLRFFTYLDAGQAGLFELEGIVDQVLVEPAPGVTADEVKQELFRLPGVSSVQEVGVLGDTLEERMGSITGVLRVLEGFALALALLIAVNSAGLAIEERRREQATMFAFGLPMGTVVRTLVTEIALTAALGTALGIGLGFLALRWLIETLTTETLPELGLETVVSAGTVGVVMVLGVLVASLAPLFAIPRLRRTDIPSTLRVLE